MVPRLARILRWLVHLRGTPRLPLTRMVMSHMNTDPHVCTLRLSSSCKMLSCVGKRQRSHQPSQSCITQHQETSPTLLCMIILFPSPPSLSPSASFFPSPSPFPSFSLPLPLPPSSLTIPPSSLTLPLRLFVCVYRCGVNMQTAMHAMLSVCNHTLFGVDFVVILKSHMAQQQHKHTREYAVMLLCVVYTLYACRFKG